VQGKPGPAALAWHPDGLRLSAGLPDGSVILFEASLQRRNYCDQYEFWYVSANHVVMRRISDGASSRLARDWVRRRNSATEPVALPVLPGVACFSGCLRVHADAWVSTHCAAGSTTLLTARRHIIVHFFQGPP
jgi:hypothetical protein